MGLFCDITFCSCVAPKSLMVSVIFLTLLLVFSLLAVHLSLACVFFPLSLTGTCISRAFCVIVLFLVFFCFTLSSYLTSLTPLNFLLTLSLVFVCACSHSRHCVAQAAERSPTGQRSAGLGSGGWPQRRPPSGASWADQRCQGHPAAQLLLGIV